MIHKGLYWKPSGLCICLISSKGGKYMKGVSRQFNSSMERWFVPKNYHYTSGLRDPAAYKDCIKWTTFNNRRKGNDIYYKIMDFSPRYYKNI